jgi:hypothetical protein
VHCRPLHGGLTAPQGFPANRRAAAAAAAAV